MIEIIMALMIILPCVALIFSVIKRARTKDSEAAANDDFTVELPNVFFSLGVVVDITALVFLIGLCLSVFSGNNSESERLLAVIVGGLLFWVGMYMIIKTLTFKVVVKGNSIIVFSAFRKPYSFTFADVISAVRQVKKNQLKSERVVIKTASGRRLIVESAELAYKKFSDRIQTEVRSEYLVGFE